MGFTSSYYFYPEEFKGLSLLAHIPDGVKVAMLRALNHTVAKARTKVLAELKAETPLSPRFLGDSLTVQKAKWNGDEAVGSIYPSNKRVPLVRYGAKPNRPGVRKPIKVQIVKGHAPSTLRHAFIPKLASGHVGVFQRVGRERLPIEERTGPSVAFFFYRQRFEDSVFDFVQKNMASRLEHEIGFILERGKV